MKREQIAFLLTAILWCAHIGSAPAATLTLDPVMADFGAQQTITVDVDVSDLGLGQVVSAFNIFVDYDQFLLDVPTVLFSENLGSTDPMAFEVFTMVDDSTAGTIGAANTSNLTAAELLALQPAGGFRLFTLSFTSLDAGSAGFSIGNGPLGLGAQVVVEVIPVPAAFWLLLTGLAGIGFATRRRRGA